MTPPPPCVPQLLLKPKFSSVEKIKTIGSTYMAAAGLSVPSGHENQVRSLSGGPMSHPRGARFNTAAPRPVISAGTPGPSRGSQPQPRQDGLWPPRPRAQRPVPQDLERRHTHVGIAVDFSAALMSKLDGINRHSFNSFRLRVGERGAGSARSRPPAPRSVWLLLPLGKF